VAVKGSSAERRARVGPRESALQSMLSPRNAKWGIPLIALLVLLTMAVGLLASLADHATRSPKQRHAMGHVLMLEPSLPSQQGLVNHLPSQRSPRATEPRTITARANATVATPSLDGERCPALTLLLRLKLFFQHVW
jgi:hypothetical protein